MGILNRTPASVDADRPASADFLRVLAAASVGSFHIWQQSWQGAGPLTHWLRAGSVGVDWLVLLSAFCLFLPWANAVARGTPLPQTRPADFYRRRALRLLPAYYASLLFSLGLAVHRGGWDATLAKDLAAHLTLTQQLFPCSYLSTRLNGAAWTLTVFALFYLVFPWLAPRCVRYPVPVLAALCAVQAGYTLWLLPRYGGEKYSSLFNQFPAFCGVLAVGLAAALVFAKLARAPWTSRFWPRVLCTALGVGALVCLDAQLRAQACAAQFQRFQLTHRMPLAVTAAAVVVCFGLGLNLPHFVRRGLARLSALTYSFYLWHQMLTVFLKYDLHLPAWAGTTPPNQTGDAAWMLRANALYWAAALAVSAAAYYGVERPAAHRLSQTAQEMRAEKAR
ncbi:acyltransferase family protein [Gemmiger sp.]